MCWEGSGIKCWLWKGLKEATDNHQTGASVNIKDESWYCTCSSSFLNAIANREKPAFICGLCSIWKHFINGKTKLSNAPSKLLKRKATCMRLSWRRIRREQTRTAECSRRCVCRSGWRRARGGARRAAGAVRSSRAARWPLPRALHRARRWRTWSPRPTRRTGGAPSSADTAPARTRLRATTQHRNTPAVHCVLCTLYCVFVPNAP